MRMHPGIIEYLSYETVVSILSNTFTFYSGIDLKGFYQYYLLV